MDKKLSLIIQFSAMDKLSGALRSIVGLGKSGTQALAGMKRAARDLETQLRGARAATAGATGNITALIAEERRLEAAIAGVNRQMDRQKRFIQIDNRVASMQARASQLQASGQQNMMAGAGMITPFVLAGREAMNFSSGMVDIQLKAQLTNAELVKMRGLIMASAKATHQLPEDMRAAVDVLSGFGMDPRQAALLTQPIGRLGTAFKVDLADAAGAAFTNVNNLRIPLSQVAASFDIMAAAGNAGAFEVKDMARWFPALTAQARALGQQGAPAVADLAAALQIARRGAANADEAGNNIVNLLQKINSPGTIRKFQKNFGVDLPAALHKAYAEGKTPLEAITELSKRVTGGNLEKLGFLFEDRQAQSALRSLILDLEDYRNIRSQIARSSGTVDRAFRTRQINDASIEWKKFRSQLSDTAINLGTTVLPAFNRFLAIVNAGVGSLSRWAQANPRLASALFTLVGGLAAARIGLGALQFAFGGLLGPMATAWGWLAKFRLAGGIAAMLPRLASGLGLARIAVLGLSRAFITAGIAIMTTPVGWVIAGVAAIAAAAYLIYRNWGPISAFFTAHWTRIRNIFLGGVVIFTPFVAAIMWAASAVYRNWGRISAATMAMVNKVRGIVGPFLAPFITINTFLAGLAGKFFNYGAQAIWGLIKGIVSVQAQATKAILGVAERIGSSFAGALGIKSPSRLFMAYGGHIAEGLAIGMESNARRPIRASGRLAAGVAGAGALALAGPAFARPGGSPQSTASTAPVTINITVQQNAGEDGEALARRVADLIKRESAAARRGSYYDA